jgi:hypothetical protein
MHRNCIKYKDVWAAPGSKLHEALESKDMQLVERLYQEGVKQARDLWDKALRYSAERKAAG